MKETQRQIIRKRLSELVPGVSLDSDVTVTGIETDSRKIGDGALFLACPGVAADGRRFIGDAIGAGAAAVLYEEGWQPEAHDTVPVVAVDHLKSRVGEIVSRYYDHPSKRLEVVAVTGTNGKTSCTHFLVSAMGQLGRDSAVIGTLGFGRLTQLTEVGLTTPGALQMQNILYELALDGVEAVAMEASSHGLVQGRFNGTEINVAVLTNLTRDHLDYHGNMSGYKAAKRILFEYPSVSVVVLNLDDQFGVELASEFSDTRKTITYSVNIEEADVYCSQTSFDAEGLSASIATPWGNGILTSGLFGEFNLSNLLAVVAVLGSQGFPLDRILESVGKIKNVTGRMDRITRDGRAEVVIDYAHTPDALTQALRAIRRHCPGSLWCVFGCGGDRDKGKRQVMGEAASLLADHIVLTDDNPRTENSEVIISDILEGITDRRKVHVEANRSRAIQFALAHATGEDVVLLAGKGHELYQEVGVERRPFSDYREVARADDALVGERTT